MVVVKIMMMVNDNGDEDNDNDGYCYDDDAGDHVDGEHVDDGGGDGVWLWLHVCWCGYLGHQ